MREFLIAITGEWRSYIVGWSILFFFLSSCMYYHGRIKKILRLPDDKSDLTGLYYWFGYIICPYTIYSGLYLTGLYINMFKNLILIHIILLIIYFIYSIIFFLSIYTLSFLQKNALCYTKIYLISFPFFTISIPILSFVICTCLSGEQANLATISLNDILYNKNPSEYVQKIRSLGTIGDIVFNIIFIMPWLIYFYFSSTMKKLWEYIDSEYDNFQEGINTLPDGVLD